MTLVIDILAVQEIDDRVAALRAAAASIQQRLSGSQDLDDARRALQVVQSRITQTQRRQRDLELDVATLTARIDPEERRLFSGEVQSPRELVSIQQEVDALKTRRSAAEDQLLEAMTRVEALQPRRAAAGARVTELEQAWDVRQVELRRELRQLEDDVAAEEVRRASQAAIVPPRPLALYEDVRRRKGGLAVARIHGSTCQACRVSLPDAARRQVMLRDALVQCPNCERILAPG